MNHDVRIRPVSEGDWGGIVALESGAYAALGLSEERSALESRVRASPGTCFVIDAEQQLAGYVLALPYPEHGYPDLTRAEETVAVRVPHPNLHLHDLVIDEGLRGRGLAKTLLHHLLATARAEGYEQISLIAVNGSDTFWAANGFTARHGVAPTESYGPGAVYMSRAVPAVAVPALAVPAAQAVPAVQAVPAAQEEVG
ncbi:GNAT family N-acetyltransferase [Streptomyces sp. NPDC087420]|uniref:GNAT family N-acetyltransferase n=1 Tax=Streptomyces sp. NPDC087420 TaxID=3365785 RepID=UPI0038364A10